MDAILISKDLSEYLADHFGETGKIHSVFQHTVNLLTDDDMLISILSKQKDVTPMSVVISAEDLNTLKLNQGMNVALFPDHLEFLETRSNLTLSQAKLWNPKSLSEEKPVNLKEYEKRLKKFEIVSK